MFSFHIFANLILHCWPSHLNLSIKHYDSSELDIAPYISVPNLQFPLVQQHLYTTNYFKTLVHSLALSSDQVLYLHMFIPDFKIMFLFPSFSTMESVLNFKSENLNRHSLLKIHQWLPSDFRLKFKCLAYHNHALPSCGLSYPPCSLFLEFQVY